jgi:peptide/nickel transport system ATP-binding protein
MSEKILQIKNLRVVYKKDAETIKAINGIDLEMNTRETLGLVGETGAGKTTLALSIMRLLPERTGRIEQGEILYRGADLLKKKEIEMRLIRGEKISMIFQDPMTSLNPVLTVGEQIAEVLRLHSKSKERIQKRVDEMLELVGIPSKRKEEFPHQFSGGMKQRVIIAIALACDPELLIADEPTTALDVTIQAQVLEMMANLKEKINTSMIMITHDLGIVAQMCDKVGVMYAGKIIEYGTLVDIFKGKKHHPYTKGLFGSIPNLQEETRRLKPIPGIMPDPANLPTGCVFQARCPKRMEICIKEEPPDYIHGTHKIKCYLF